MRCSTNNQASTVLKCFVETVQSYGLPSRVRTDQGRENILVAQYQLEHRGHGRNSIITGSSVHNQRVERIWRDMHHCVTQLYYRLFYFLEQIGILDPTNELHLFALHHVYLARINMSLTAFKNGWNMHSIRTERNHTPLQLFHSGALRLQNCGLKVDISVTAHSYNDKKFEVPFILHDPSLQTMDLFQVVDDSYVALIMKNVSQTVIMQRYIGHLTITAVHLLLYLLHIRVW